MNFTPIGSRLLVKPAEDGEKETGSGIVILTKQEGAIQGTVMALGDGGMGDIDPHDLVSVGDIVFFGRHAGDDFRSENKDGTYTTYKVLRPDSLLGVCKK